MQSNNLLDILKYIIITFSTISFLINFLKFTINYSKYKLTKLDKLIIINSINLMLALFFTFFILINDLTFKLKPIVVETLTRHFFSVFSVFSLFSSYFIYNELSNAFTDPFRIIKYLVNKESSVIKELVLLISLSFLSQILDFLFTFLCFTNNETDNTLKNILNFIFFNKKLREKIRSEEYSLFDILYISYNPIIVLSIITLFIYSLFEIRKISSFTKNLKFKSSHQKIILYSKINLSFLIFYLLLYIISFILLQALTIPYNQSFAVNVFSLISSGYVLIEGMFFIRILGFQDYFHNIYQFSLLGRLTKYVFCIYRNNPIEDYYEKHGVLLNEDQNKKIRLEDSIYQLHDMSGYTFETYEISLCNSYVYLMLMSYQKVLPLILSHNEDYKKYKISIREITKNNDLNENDFSNFNKSQCKEIPFDKPNIHYTNDNSKILISNTDEHDSNISNNVFNSLSNNVKENLIETNQSSTLANLTVNENYIMIESIYNNKLLSSISEDKSKIEVELSNLNTEIVNQMTAHPSFIKYYLNFIKNDYSKIYSKYKSHKFSLYNNTYYIQILREERQFYNYLNSYLNYKSVVKSSFLEEIISAYSFKIKSFPRVFVFIIKNKFISPSMISSKEYSMWQILQVKNEVKSNTKNSKGNLRIVSSSNMKNNIISFEKKEGNQIENNKIKVIQIEKESKFESIKKKKESEVSGLVYDPNDFILEENKFELLKFDKFISNIKSDIEFFEILGINDFSLNFLYFEIGKNSDSGNFEGRETYDVVNKMREIENINKNQFSNIKNKENDETLKFAIRLSNISKNFSIIKDNEKNQNYNDFSMEPDEFFINSKNLNEIEIPFDGYIGNLIDYRCIFFFQFDIFDYLTSKNNGKIDKIIHSLKKKRKNRENNGKCLISFLNYTLYDVSIIKNISFLFNLLFCNWFSSLKSKEVYKKFNNSLEKSFKNAFYSLSTSEVIIKE